MCGIVGYVGNRNATPVLLDCLKRLEYRGYDSAGVALLQVPGMLEISRTTQGLRNLEEKIERLNGHAHDARVGIAHTRWATHGRATEGNAHPHRSPDGKIAVVHNGIFENHREILAELAEHGLAPTSQTDTECFPMLMQHLMQRGAELDQAFEEAVSRMCGQFAVACLHANHPGRLLVARRGAPLVIGVGAEEHFVASDMTALLQYTRDALFLEDGDIIELTSEGVRQLGSSRRVSSIQHIEWDAGAAELGAFTHYMQKEIFEQPAAVARTVAEHLRQGRVELELPFSSSFLCELDRIVILACGTSLHAGMVAKFAIEELAGVPVEVDYASEYRYRGAVRSDRTLAIAITQSGETADTLGALREAQSRGAKSLGICNVVGSQVTREADATLLTRAGPEIGVASTKAFTTQLAVLMLLAAELGKTRGVLGSAEEMELVRGFAELPAALQLVQSLDDDLSELAGDWHRATNALYLGRGPLFPIALEGALKLKEISYVHAEGLPSGEMKHGPIALIDERMPVIALVGRDSHRERVLSNLQEAASRDGRIIGFVPTGDTGIRAIAHDVFELPDVHPRLSPILYAVPLQMFAYHMAVRRGCDVDRPRNLAKSVTVE